MMFDEDTDADKIDINKDIQMVVGFLVPRKRLEAAISRSGNVKQYMVLPVIYPERNNVFGEYAWLVFFCPKHIIANGQYSEWVKEIKCDPYIYSEAFGSMPEV